MFAIRDRSSRVIAFSGRTLETDKAKMRGGKYVNSPESAIFKKSNVLYAFDLAGGCISKAKPLRRSPTSISTDWPSATPPMSFR